MKAEDTVMTPDQINTLAGLEYSPDMDEAELFEVALQGVARAQAQISFSAGLGEVLDFLQKYPYETQMKFNNFFRIIRMPKEEWETQLKEWNEGDAHGG